MSSKLLIVAALLVARVVLFGQVPGNAILFFDKEVVETSAANSSLLALNVDLLHDHLGQIVDKKMIRSKICDQKLLKSKSIYVSIGRNNPMTRFRLEKPISSKRKNLYIHDSKEIFFSLNDKYLQLINIYLDKDEIVYEVLTHSGGNAKINLEIHSTFYFRLIENEYELVKTDFSEIQTLNLKKL